ncbi:MAG: hypothetical protein JWO36_623 [Myxococcales bacterium]|nr:hypothetical protein [Myxococcales bacterium]
MKARYVLGVLAVVAVWRMCSARHDASADPDGLQAGVVPGGFMFAMGDDVIGYRIAELDRNGHEVRVLPVDLKRDARVVGTPKGSAIGWLDRKRLKLAALDADGGYGNATTWGNNVRQLCEGAASNEYRFGVGFVESDGRVRIVHGPMGSTRVLAEPVVTNAALAGASWCGVASAEQNIALFWREGSRLLLSFCGHDACSDVVARVPIERGERVVGFGCIRDSCLVAARGKRGATRLLHVSEDGRVTVTSLDTDPDVDRPVRIVGAGPRAFAMSYYAKDGWTKVVRVTIDGARTELDRAGSPGSLILAWANGKLLLGFGSGATHVVDLQP